MAFDTPDESIRDNGEAPPVSLQLPSERFKRGSELRTFLEGRLTLNADPRPIVSNRRTALWFILVLIGEKRGTSFHVSTRDSSTLTDICRTFETSDLRRTLDSNSIPYFFRLETRPGGPTPALGELYVSLDQDALREVASPDAGGHTVQGSFYGFPEDSIAAFNTETVDKRELPQLIKKTGRPLTDAATLDLVGYAPRATPLAVNDAIDRGCRYRDSLLFLAERYDFPEIADALGFLLERRAKLFVQDAES